VQTDEDIDVAPTRLALRPDTVDEDIGPERCEDGLDVAPETLENDVANRLLLGDRAVLAEEGSDLPGVLGRAGDCTARAGQAAEREHGSDAAGLHQRSTSVEWLVPEGQVVVVVVVGAHEDLPCR
jgi:hypothetical protein